MSENSMFKGQMFLSRENLKQEGLSDYKIRQLTEKGIIKKLNNRFYENLQYEGDISDYNYASVYVPEGVICLLSAAVYYNLSSYRPDAVEVAIPRKAKVSSLPDWPEIRIHYFTEERFSAGIEVQSQNGMAFQIYDIEKTVADILYYRERVGIEETKEVMLNYLRREDRNLNKLICYANQLKCANVLNYYLEVLL